MTHYADHAAEQVERPHNSRIFFRKLKNPWKFRWESLTDRCGGDVKFYRSVCVSLSVAAPHSRRVANFDKSYFIQLHQQASPVRWYDVTSTHPPTQLIHSILRRQIPISKITLNLALTIYSPAYGPVRVRYTAEFTATICIGWIGGAINWLCWNIPISQPVISGIKHCSTDKWRALLLKSVDKPRCCNLNNANKVQQ